MRDQQSAAATGYGSGADYHTERSAAEPVPTPEAAAERNYRGGVSIATTGFWPVKDSLKSVIDYAENPDKTTDPKYLDDDLYRALSYTQNDEKTDKKMYVSTINCPKHDPYGAMIATKKQFGKMGGNVAYHGYQSFKPGEVTPEEAHKIGMETAKQMWGADYQIVVTTHLNTDSLHNHFVINSVSFKTGRKFENHVSDHYKLREISDAICREHHKSVLENATFYGGEKKAYWVRKNGGQTHRDMLRRDINEALSMTASYAAFCRYLEGLGYHFTRDRNGNHPALTAPGWQRAVRLDRLGAKYTPDAIYDRIIANQRLPELYVTYYPAKRRTPLMEMEWEMKRLNRMSSIELMFELFVAMLKLCTGTNFSENKSVPLSPQLREEVRKLDQYIDDMQLLCKYHIGTAEELSAFREETIQKIHALVQERNGIYNKIRRAAEPEKTELKAKARAVSQQIAPLRKELKCADRIWDRSLERVQSLLDQERQMEIQVMNRYKERSYER